RRQRRTALLAALACLLILTGITTSRCQSPHRATPPATQGRPAPLRAAADPPDDPGVRLTAALDGYLANRPGRVSVAVADHGSGLVATYHANLRFETASIVKVDVLATLLLVAQDAHRELTQTERSLARQMIGESDNDAADDLWEAVGGSKRIAQANRRFGLASTVLNAAAWGKTTTTVADQLRLLNVVLDGAGPLGPHSVAQARAFMGSIADDQSWGISAAARPGEAFQLKNGWDKRDADHGRWMVHSAGAIRAADGPVTIVVLSDGHAAMNAGVAIVEQVARLARAQLG